MPIVGTEREYRQALTIDDLASQDERIVNQIRALLQAARGYPGQNRESSQQRQAAALLRELLVPMIIKICEKRLKPPSADSRPEDVAQAIFASRVWGAPYLKKNGSYKTWLEAWNPERGTFRTYVALTTKYMAGDWQKSIARRRPSDGLVSLSDHYDTIDVADSARGPMDIALDNELQGLVRIALEALRPGLSTDAIRAVVERDPSPAEYAAELGITAEAASMRMLRGARSLEKKLKEMADLGQVVFDNVERSA